MQTFLPYPDFDQSADTLDNKRLGNQCYRETLTLYRGGWRHHPASKMWRGHERHLCFYGLACARAMTQRGTWRPEVCQRWNTFWSTEADMWPPQPLPSWIGSDDIHRSHQSNLVRKDSDHYGPLFPGVPDDLEYVWPV